MKAGQLQRHLTVKAGSSATEVFSCGGGSSVVEAVQQQRRFSCRGGSSAVKAI